MGREKKKREREKKGLHTRSLTVDAGMFSNSVQVCEIVEKAVKNCQPEAAIERSVCRQPRTVSQVDLI